MKTRVILGASLAPSWEGHRAGVASLPGPKASPIQLAAFLRDAFARDPRKGLFLIPLDGPRLEDIALARSLAGLSGRLHLRALRACGPAAWSIAQLCGQASELAVGALETLAALLDARTAWLALGPTPAPAWAASAMSHIARYLPGLWWLFSKESTDLKLGLRPPRIEIEGTWHGTARGGFPPPWWHSNGCAIVWRDSPASDWRDGWITLTRLPDQAEIERLKAAAKRLNPSFGEVEHGTP